MSARRGPSPHRPWPHGPSPAEFADWLDAPGPPFSATTPVRLGDVFTPPALVLHGGPKRPARDPVAAALDAGRLLVSGPQRVGRTTLAKRLVVASRERGEVAVYARGDAFAGDLRPEAVARRLRRLAAEQTGERAAPTVLVLDDLDRARLAGARGAQAVGRRDVLRALGPHVDRLVAFTTQYDLAARVNADPDVDMAAASLGSFDRARRSDLAARFVEAIAPADRWKAFMGPTRRILDALFGGGRLPSFPYYVLVALGELYTGDPAQIDGTSYGQYYEAVVREAARAAREG